MYNEFFNQIKNNEIITIFRHVRPDGDAFGSSLGLKRWINDNFPNKQVFVLGKEKSNDDFFEVNDECSDDMVKESLAIIVDTSNADRVDDQRFASAKYIFRVDHHPKCEDFGNDMIIDVKSAATCELLADIFSSDSSFKMSKETCELLYRGLLTDTIGFKTTNTTTKTLSIASLLTSHDLNIAKLNQEMFDRSLKDFEFSSFIRSKLTIEDQIFGYAIISIDDYTSKNVSEPEVGKYVSEFGAIKELEVWALITQCKDENTDEIYYRASLRSKNIAVNTIASHFNGGGHKNAAGIGKLSENDKNALIEEIKQNLPKNTKKADI